MKLGRHFPPGFFGPGGAHRAMFGGSGAPVGAFVVILLLVIVIIAAVGLFLRDRSRHQPGAVDVGGPSRGALLILNERFAKGDIDVEDYKVRRDLLQGSA